MRERIRNEYFEWLYNLACGERYSSDISYRKLLTYLHSREFTYLIPRDINRAKDGISLRYRFGLYFDYPNASDDLIGPCSILEMMLALAIRCEENIMDDPGIGDRTGQWFWGMIANLGLRNMTDNVFDESVVDEIINRFLNREYEPDGAGGLFTIRHCEYDLRTVEIWYQLCWYLDNFA